jgi:hypothetical protein
LFLSRKEPACDHGKIGAAKGEPPADGSLPALKKGLIMQKDSNDPIEDRNKMHPPEMELEPIRPKGEDPPGATVSKSGKARAGSPFGAFAIDAPRPTGR